MTRIHLLDPNPGGNPAVLLLHGLGATGESWGLQTPALAEAGFRPLAPDLPGFGKSLYDGGGWSFEGVSRELRELLDSLGCCRIHLLGISMGGAIAQRFANAYPEYVRSLVLVSTFSRLRPKTPSAWIYFLLRYLAVMTMKPASQARLVAERVFPGPSRQFLRELLITSISGADHRAYRLAIREIIKFDSRPWLEALQLPVLVIGGEDDSTVPIADQLHLARSIQACRCVILADAGHAASVDQPAEFNRIVLQFLTSIA